MADHTKMLEIIARVAAARAAGAGAGEQEDIRRLMERGATSSQHWSTGEEAPGLEDQTQATLDFHALALASLSVGEDIDVGQTWKTPEKNRRTSYVGELLREARVFSFHPKVFAYLHRAADKYTTEVLSGLTYESPRDSILEAETASYLSALVREGVHVEFPEKWPFETIFVGFGNGIHVGEAEWILRESYYREQFPHETMTSAITRGLLVSTKNDGTVISFEEFSFRQADGTERRVLIPEVSRYGGVWTRALSLMPWISQSLSWLLNSYRTFVEEKKVGLNGKYAARSVFKKMGTTEGRSGWCPRPYYVLKMKPEILEELVRSPQLGPAFRYTYRFDVRGHERVRVRRGTLPMDPRNEKKLSEAGYKIYDNEIGDQEDLKRLFARHMPPKRPNEWIAVLTTWVDSYKKGPDGTPYIPAVRIPAPGFEPE